MRCFLDLLHLSSYDLRNILNASLMHKSKRSDLLAGKMLVCIFEKPSTRTRLSFYGAMRALGGDVMILNAEDTQLSRGERIEDTAAVLSRYADFIMLRALSHNTLLDLAAYASVPVINGLTDRSHPCQVMADLMTFEEKTGESSEGKIFVWYGDFNNMTWSWVHAAEKLKFFLRLAVPSELVPHQILDSDFVSVYDDPMLAAAGAHCLMTDTWVSMGDKETVRKVEKLRPFSVRQSMLEVAEEGVLFMHCLPAHIGDEVSEEVFTSKASVVFLEAENRLHVQKSILMWLSGLF